VIVSNDVHDGVWIGCSRISLLWSQCSAFLPGDVGIQPDELVQGGYAQAEETEEDDQMGARAIFLHSGACLSLSQTKVHNEGNAENIRGWKGRGTFFCQNKGYFALLEGRMS